MADEKKSNIDYQMYLNYLDSIEKEKKDNKKKMGTDSFEDETQPENQAPYQRRQTGQRQPEDSNRQKKAQRSDYSGGSKKPPKNKAAHKKKRRKRLIIAIVIILAVVAIAAAGLYFSGYIDKMLGTIGGVGEKSLGVLENLESEDSVTHGDIFYEPSAAESYSIETWVDGWSNLDGQPMYNNKILNILLLGCDDPEGDELERSRSDCMVIISIDTINKKIKMTSVWRDTYTKIEIPQTDYQQGGTSHEKLNASCFYGGPDLTEQTIEDMYKIRIDGWVQTTFSNFKKLIDAMGGIEVEVTEKENEYLVRTAPVSWHGTSGKSVTLDGASALVYSRIRHLDGDQQRTERQRKVLSAMIDKAGNMSSTELFKAIKAYLPYIKTNLSNDDIIGLGEKALFGGWKDFEITQMTAPKEEDTESYWGGTYNGAWVWLVDVPKTAQEVQEFIYGGTEGYDSCKLQLAESRNYVSNFAPGGG